MADREILRKASHFLARRYLQAELLAKTKAFCELLFEELKPAPEYVRNFIYTLPEDQVLVARYKGDARVLADKYQAAGIVAPTCQFSQPYTILL